MNFKILYFLDFLFGGLGLLLLKLRRRRHFEPDLGFDRIVVLKFIGNGSLISAAPSLYAVKKRYSAAKMYLYTTENLSQQMKMLKIFDGMILLDPGNIIASLRGFFKLRRQFSSGRTLIINLEFYSKTAAVIAALFGGDFILSLSRKNCFAADFNIPSENVPVPLLYDEIAKFLAAKTDILSFREYLFAGEVEKRSKILVAAPFCSNLSLRRKWDMDKWGRLLTEFCTSYPQYEVAIIGAPENRNEAEQIISRIKNSEKVHNYCGETDFSGSFEIIKNSSCFCGIDSAPLHLSRLAGVPSVSLWGATDPEILTGSIENYPEIIIFSRQKCSPCVHINKKCFFPGGCINTITEKTVFDSIEKILNEKTTFRKILSNDQKEQTV